MVFAKMDGLPDDEQRRRIRGHIALGYHPDTKDWLLLPDEERDKGTYILGTQGSGKSGLLENMILSDAYRGRAIVVIDPHGDLITNCLAAMPKGRLAKTYVLDMEDEEFPFGINLFGLSGRPKNSIEKSQAVSRIMHVFDVLWEDVLKQQYLTNYVKTATIALIHHPSMTLTHMQRFLTDKPFRDSILADVPDPSVHEFWRGHDALKDQAQDTRIQPLLNRLGTLFIGRDLVQNIVGQQTTVSFRRAIENREIIFIKLPTTTLEQDARLIGTVIIAQISAALFSFIDTPAHERPGFSLFVDEFQNFSTPDFAKMFSEGRKFGVWVTLAHQYRQQLIEQLQEATATAQTKICLKLTVDNAKKMADYFPVDTKEVRREDASDNACDTLMKQHSHFPPVVQTFAKVYLQPLSSYRKAGKIQIRNPGGDFVGFGRELVQMMKDGTKLDVTEYDDPLPFLNPLLHEAMLTNNPNLYIPPQVVKGFANGGRGFLSQVRFPLFGGKLHAGVQYPQHLVIPDSKGYRWSREPTNSGEQLWHFIYHLRETMKYLAKHPIGKETGSKDNVAQWLSQLPQRKAFVRMGDDICMMKTHDTAPKLVGEGLRLRLAAVRDQSRVKYCHARVVVSQLVSQAAGTLEDGATIVIPRELVKQGGSLSGWEEVGEP